MVVLPIEDDDAVHACESAPSLLLLGAPGGGDDKSLETARRNMLVLRRPSSSSSDVLVFSPLFFFRSFCVCVLCVCVLCVKTEEEEQEEVSVLFLFFVSKNFISFYFRPGFLDTCTHLYSSDKTLPRTAESFVIERWG